MRVSIILRIYAAVQLIVFVAAYFLDFQRINPEDWKWLWLPLLFPLGVVWASFETKAFVGFWFFVALAGWLIAAMWGVGGLLIVGAGPSGMLLMYLGAMALLIPGLVIMTRQIFRRPAETPSPAPRLGAP